MRWLFGMLLVGLLSGCASSVQKERKALDAAASTAMMMNSVRTPARGLEHRAIWIAAKSFLISATQRRQGMSDDLNALQFDALREAEPGRARPEG
jgi:hypothetical protein